VSRGRAPGGTPAPAAARPGAALLAGVGLALLALACDGEPGSPEARVRALVDRVGEAAAARDAGALLDLVSEDYRDGHGRDKQALKALVLRYVLANEAIHVTSRVKELAVGPDAESAELVVVAALTAAPVAEPGELAGLDADLFRFELDVARETDGAWRVTSAGWRRARLAELL